MYQGQVAQSVEQGTENPRVGGSIPSLATLIVLALAGCQTDHCENLCFQTSLALQECLQEWPATWEDFNTTSRATFQNTCAVQWVQTQSGLEARELDDALQQCQETVLLLDEMSAADQLCDQLRAIYLP